MKRILTTLRKLCPGRLSIEIDHHKLYNETAEKYITDNPTLFDGVTTNVMIKNNQIVKVEAAPITKPMPPAVAYSHDVELALKDALNQIEVWEPESQK